MGEIKKGLGWDTKRVNRALDRDDRDRATSKIDRSYLATPTRYTAKA